VLAAERAFVARAGFARTRSCAYATPPKEGAHGGTMGSPVLEELGGRAEYPGWGAFPRTRR